MSITTGKRTTRILRNLKIDEVSGVDKGAGHGVKIMLMKRDGDTEDDTDLSPLAIADAALAKSIASILADGEVIDRQRAIAETYAQYKKHLALNPDLDVVIEKRMALSAFNGLVDVVRKQQRPISRSDAMDVVLATPEGSAAFAGAK